MSRTLVQRPTPINSMPNVAPAIASRPRRAPTAEVIDVDDLFEEISRSRGSSNHRVHPNVARDVIDVDGIDVDDDIQILGGPSQPGNNTAGNGGLGVGHRPYQQRIPRRTIFSPPPRPQDNTIPPVPPIPLPFREPPPLRYRPPDYAAGVFRPMDRPFPFEDNLRRRANRLANEEPAAPGNAEAQNRERRRNMGLGGAVLMLNRQRQLVEEHARVREQDDNPWVNLGVDTLGLLRRVFGFGRERAGDEDDELLEALALSRAEHEGGPNVHFPPLLERLNIVPHRMARNTPVEYRPAYTHPLKPEPGFSNNFSSPDVITVDQPGPSNAPITDTGTILVCAKCLDPLVMNVTGSEDDIRRNRLWALRCGHMLDGKCIEPLMKPSASTDDVVDAGTQISSVPSSSKDNAEDNEGDEIEDGLRHDVPSRPDKGKRKASALEDDTDYVPIDRKGKGRACAVQQLGPVVSNDQPVNDASPPQPPDNCIRSRLRPRKPQLKVEEGSLSTEDATSSMTEQIQGTPQTPILESSAHRTRVRRRVVGARNGRGRAAPARGKAKGKAKAKAPVIEARHEWFCPVCHHQHGSILIDGVWKMDEEGEKGAIALYV